MNFNDQMYKLSLDDYSAASFTSFDKDYFGTINMIQDFIFSIQNDEKISEDYKSLINTFDKYKQNKNITHSIAYKEIPFLIPVDTIATMTSSFENHKWEHINTWGYPYNMKADKIYNTHIWLSYEKTFIRCIKSSFTNLAYEHLNGVYASPGMIWGFPHQIEEKNTETYSRLFVIEKTFNNKDELLKDIKAFRIKQDPVFTEVLNDIFGDG